MFKFWSKKNKETEAEQASPPSESTPTETTPDEKPVKSSADLTWDDQAVAGLEQALGQAPVPAMMKGKVKKELRQAAEEVTRKANRTTVTAEDVMNGMLAKMPANMRQQVEDAMDKGPEGLKDLEKKLRKG